MELSLLGPVLSIVIINIILSGDNALVIALATRGLAPEHRRKAVFWGVTVAVVLQIVLTFGVAYLLEIPFIRSIGGVLLLIIAVKLLIDDDQGSFDEHPASLSGAIKTIIVADLLMSLDNVLGVAAISNGNMKLLFFGLTLSIPIIVYGSNFIRHILNKWPITIFFGATVLGWTAGEMLWKDWSFLHGSIWEIILPLACALTVLIVGKSMRDSRQDYAVWAQEKVRYPEKGAKGTKS